MSYKQIRERVAWDILNTSSVEKTGGKVHKYGPWATTWTDFAVHFQGEGIVHAWTMTRAAVARPLNDLGSVPFWEARHAIQVSGYYTFGKGGQTEEDFQDIIDDVCHTFQSDFRLGAQSGDPLLLVPMKIAVPVIDHQPLGEVVCIHCRLDLAMRERELIQGAN